MEDLATRLQIACNARDIDTLRGLLAEGAIWGDDRDDESFCHNRAEIIAHVKRLLNDGVKPLIVDTITGPCGIAAHVEVEWPHPEEVSANRVDVFQVYVVADGLVTEIHGHDDEDSARAAISL